MSLNPARLGFKTSFPFENTRSIAALDGDAVFDFMKISFNALCAKHEGLTCLCGAAVRNSWTSLVALCLRSVERSYRRKKNRHEVRLPQLLRRCSKRSILPC